MASINGDWFHSRSSSNRQELLTVRTLVLESQKPEYAGFNWSKGRYGDEMVYQFASAADIQPSTMQTKIRAMIRYGFIRDVSECPLEWTRIGHLWNELYEVSNSEAEIKIYQLTLTIALSIFAFNDSKQQFSINPANGEMPLRFLLNQLDEQDEISLQTFEQLVDGNTKRVGRNITYWKRDLINSGLFKELNDKLVYTGEFTPFTEEVKSFNPSLALTDDDWREIRDNPLTAKSPFKDAIRKILEDLVYEQDIEEKLADSFLTAPLVNEVAEETEKTLPEDDILGGNETFAKSIKRVRNATWSLRIKKKYEFTCVVPKCDVKSNLFVEAAHIKPDNVPEEEESPHRTHILNGLCLCKHCHAAFDKGYFSLTNSYKVLTSDELNKIPEQYQKHVLLSSTNQRIKTRVDERMPLVEFIQYHRSVKFKP